MKKRFLYIIVLASVAMVTCCKKEICGTADYEIINQIESDIVVILNDSGKITTIRPGETQRIHHSEWCRDAEAIPSMPPEVLDAEMRIGGEIMPKHIWWSEYWDITSGNKGNNYRKYTLTVTYELLETIKKTN